MTRPPVPGGYYTAEPNPAPTDSLRPAILRHLRTLDAPATAREIALVVATRADTAEVRSILGTLARGPRVERVHSPDGILRYRLTAATEAERAEPIGPIANRVMDALQSAQAPLRNADLRAALGLRDDLDTGRRINTALNRYKRRGLVAHVGASVATAWYLLGSAADPHRNDSPTPAPPTAPARHSCRASDAAAGLAPEFFSPGASA